MKSGSRKYKFDPKIDDRDLPMMHSKPGCKGEFTSIRETDAIVTFDAIGPQLVPHIPLIHCRKCGATYDYPTFREWLEQAIAIALVSSTKHLTKQQIKFLRLHFDKSQEEMAELVGVTDRHEYSKIESLKTDKMLSADKQVRLKILCAEMLGIKDSKVIYSVNRTLEDEAAEVSPEQLDMESDKRLLSLLKIAS